MVDKCINFNIFNYIYVHIKELPCHFKLFELYITKKIIFKLISQYKDLNIANFIKASLDQKVLWIFKVYEINTLL